MNFRSVRFNRWLSKPVLGFSALFMAALFFAEHSSAQWGSGSAVYTKQGIEVSADSRVTALFAMLNGQGYDVEEVKGPPPLQLPQYSKARVNARSALGRPGTGMRKFGKFVSSKPGSVRKYMKATLQLGPSPTFEPQGKISKIGRGIYGPMRTWFNEEGGIRIQQLVTESVKSDQRQLKALLEKTCQPLVESIRLGDEEEQLLDDTGPSGRVIVSLNPLDSHNALYRIQSGEVTYLIAGISTDKNWSSVVDAATFAFARTLVSQEVEKNVGKGTLGDGFADLPKKIQKRVKTKEGYVTDLVACALVKHIHPTFKCSKATTPINAGKLQPIMTKLSERIGQYMSGDTLFTEAISSPTAPLAADESSIGSDAGVPDESASETAEGDE